MAWSFAARYRAPLPGCTHVTCANCARFALAWREDVVASIPTHEPLSLFDCTAACGDDGEVAA
jgi:hypothetical protein